MQDLAREEIFKIKPYVPGKPVEEAERELGITDVIKLASNENPLGPSPRAIEAITAFASKVNAYPDGNCFYLKKALAAGLNCAPEEIVLGNGSDNLLMLLGATFLNPADEIIMGSPSFSEYDFSAKVMGAKTVKVPLKNFTYDLEGIAAALTDKTKIVFICNPNNPTGTIVTAAEVESFMREIPDNVLVVFDEAYYEYVGDATYPDSLQYVKKNKNVIVLRTFSKIYGLAGLRIGYGVAPKEIISAINRVREPFNVNLLAQKAALAALSDADFLEKSRAVNAAGKEMLYDALRARGLEFVPTEGNFIFINTGLDSQEVFQKLLRQGVIVRTGDIFGHHKFIRVTVGTSRENKRFIAALEKVLN